MSYELVVGPDFIIRKLKGLPDLQLTRNEVTHIQEQPFGLRVETADKRRLVFVHRSLVGYEEVKQRLRDWNEISYAREESWTSKPWLATVAGIVSLLLFAIFVLVRKPWITVTTGVSLALLLLLSFVAIQRSPHVDKRTKRRMLILIFPLLAVIVGTTNALREILR